MSIRPRALLYSPRGHPLVFMPTLGVGDRNMYVLTVENYLKWYELYVVKPDYLVMAVEFTELEEYCGDESPYCDHVPNPNAVLKMCKDKGWDICEQSAEVMIGRWESEYKDNYRSGIW